MDCYLLLLSVILIGIVSVQGQNCPLDSVIRVQQCLTQTGIVNRMQLGFGQQNQFGQGFQGNVNNQGGQFGTNQQGGQFGGQPGMNQGFGQLSNGLNGQKPVIPDVNLMHLRTLCQNRSFETAVECVQTFFRECQTNLQMMQILRGVMDPQRMQSAAQLICGSLQTLELHSRCINDQAVDIRNCEQWNTDKLNTKLADLRFAQPNRPIQAVGSQPPVDDVTRLNCEYTGEIINCQGNTISYHCNDQVGRMMADYRKAFAPPLCTMHLFGWSSAPRTGSSAILATLFSVVMALFMK